MNDDLNELELSNRLKAYHWIRIVSYVSFGVCVVLIGGVISTASFVYENWPFELNPVDLSATFAWCGIMFNQIYKFKTYHMDQFSSFGIVRTLITGLAFAMMVSVLFGWFSY